MIFDPDESTDDEVRGTDLIDGETGRPRVQADKCPTCIFRPGDLMHLRPGTVKAMVDEARNSFIPCHDTLPRVSDTPPAVCAGWYECHGERSQTMQILTMLFGKPIYVAPAPRKGVA